MIAGLTLVLMLVLVVLTGGSLRRLGEELRLHHEVPVLVLFVLQGMLRGRLPFTAEVGSWSIVTWAIVCIVLVTLLWPDRHLVGLPVVITGFLCNTLVVLMNGGMPYLAPAASVVTESSAFYVPANSTTYLLWLGDVLPLPFDRWIVSLGDMLLMVGVIALAIAVASGQANQRAASIR